MKYLAPAVCVAVVTVVVSGCGSGTSATATPTAAAPSPATTPAAGVAPTTTAAVSTSAVPTTSAPPRDATPEDLHRARVPAACDLPALTLEKGRVPERYAPARGGIEEPYATADLDGDGAREIAGLYRCRTDRGRTRPPVIVVARSGGSTVGAANLDRGRRRSVIDRLEARGAAIDVTWHADDGAGSSDTLRFRSVLQVRDGRLVLDDTAAATPTPTPPPTGLPTPGPTPAPTAGGSPVVGTTEFATPSGNTYCRVSADQVRCTAERTTFTPPPDPGCSTGWGRTVGLDGAAAAVMTCAPDAWVGSPAQPSWWQPGVDTRTTSLGQRDAYALGYGHVLTAGAVSCSVSERTGVTCTKGAHGFTLSRDAYRVW